MFQIKKTDPIVIVRKVLLGNGEKKLVLVKNMEDPRLLNIFIIIRNYKGWRIVFLKRLGLKLKIIF